MDKIKERRNLNSMEAIIKINGKWNKYTACEACTMLGE
jgi:hypothetical protein